MYDSLLSNNNITYLNYKLCYLFYFFSTWRSIHDQLQERHHKSSSTHFFVLATRGLLWSNSKIAFKENCFWTFITFLFGIKVYILEYGSVLRNFSSAAIILKIEWVWRIFQRSVDFGDNIPNFCMTIIPLSNLITLADCRHAIFNLQSEFHS